MDIFEEVTDTFEEGIENTKKWIQKNKGFAIAIVVVAIIGIFVWYKRNTSQTTESVYLPTTYDGYPTLSDSAYNDLLSGGTSVYDDNSFYNDLITDMDNSYSEQMSDIITSVDNMQLETDKQISQIIDSYNAEKLRYDETISYLQEQQQKSNIISQMANNSNLYNLTDSEAEQNRLHQENLQLGASLGATFDDDSGTWWLNGERLYITTQEQTGANTPVVTPSNNISLNTSPTSTQDITKVVSQMQSNSALYNSATSQAEKDKLHAENVKLGESIRATFNDGSGVWTLNGERLYTLPDNSGSTSSGSTSSNKSGSTSSGSTSSNKSGSTSSGSTSSSVPKGYSAENMKTNPTTGTQYSTVAPSWLTNAKKNY